MTLYISEASALREGSRLKKRGRANRVSTKRSSRVNPDRTVDFGFVLVVDGIPQKAMGGLNNSQNQYPKENNDQKGNV